MKSIDKCVSNKISNLNLFLSVFLLHCTLPAENSLYMGGMEST